MLDDHHRYLALARSSVPPSRPSTATPSGRACPSALACDLRYAAEDAKLGVNFARLGLDLGHGLDPHPAARGGSLPPARAPVHGALRLPREAKRSASSTGRSRRPT